jgi:hypothetical protein
MKLSVDQRKALEAAGYKISKSGKTVEGKNGGTIGGINENGKLFSGSKKVMDILKNPDSAAPKADAKPAAKPRAPKKDDKPATKDAMTGYRKGDVTASPITPRGGRGDGGAERVRRAADTALDRASRAQTSASAKSPKSEKRIPGRALWLALTGGGNPKNYMDQARGMAKGGLVKKTTKPAKTYKK